MTVFSPVFDLAIGDAPGPPLRKARQLPCAYTVECTILDAPNRTKLLCQPDITTFVRIDSMMIHKPTR